MKKIKIVIAEDHGLVRKGLIACLSKSERITIVGEASNGLEAVEMVRNTNPDIILMDISMPGMNGLEATKTILSEFPNMKILVLTGFEEDEYIRCFLKLGAKGFVFKDISSKELIKAIDSINEGNLYFNNKVKEIILSDYSKSFEKPQKKDSGKLTEREIEILKLIAEGLQNKEIAKKLKLSVKTVNTHRQNIKFKLNIKSSASLAKYAIENGLIQIPMV